LAVGVYLLTPWHARQWPRWARPYEDSSVAVATRAALNGAGRVLRIGTPHACFPIRSFRPPILETPWPCGPPPHMKLDRAGGHVQSAGRPRMLGPGESGARFEVVRSKGGTNPVLETDPRRWRYPLMSHLATGRTHSSV
jgi:hypothetical protein